MSKSLVLHPSPTAQWQALVHDARVHAGIELNEELESYLVFLLMRFNDNPQVLQHVLANDFLIASQQNNLSTLREVGDKCLLFSGLFPKSAQRKRVPISYFVKLGQSAYSTLSERKENQLASLYFQLCHEFVELMDVLQTMRHSDPNAQNLNLLEAEALWNDTHSKNALKTLKESTSGFLVPDHDPSTKYKH